MPGLKTLGSNAHVAAYPLLSSFSVAGCLRVSPLSEGKLAPLLVEHDFTWRLLSATVALTRHSCTLHRGSPLRSAIGTRGFSPASLTTVKFFVPFWC